MYEEFPKMTFIEGKNTLVVDTGKQLMKFSCANDYRLLGRRELY